MPAFVAGIGLNRMAARHNHPDAQIVLALDTAGSACAVAVCRGPDTLAVDRRAMRHGHATAVLPMIQQALEKAGLTFAAIDRYVVNRGPGGFTGLRVGLAAMGGLALATGRPVVGVDGFDLLAHRARRLAPTPWPLIAAIDSRRPEPYVQAYGADGRRLGDPRCLAREQLADALRQAAGSRGRLAIIGDAAGVATSAAGSLDVEVLAADGPDPVALAQIGRATEADRQPPLPLYIRPVDAVPAPPARGISA